MFNAIVCIKAVIKGGTDAHVNRSEHVTELNPFDRQAIHLALALTSQYGGSVTALSIGPASCDFVLYEAVALGCDQGVLICDERIRGSDTIATSRVLAAGIQQLPKADLIFMGTQTSDSDASQVGPQTAVMLDLPLVTRVQSIAPERDTLRLERIADGFREVYNVAPPAVLTIHPSAAEPPCPSLLGLEMAYQSAPIAHWSLDKIGLDEHRVGDSGSPTRVQSISEISTDRECKFLDGTVAEQTETLLKNYIHQGTLR
ncbi:MAG: electron transfer flavoprotein subunit beta/FixA family protein [Myxococcota bacterium]|nr:electron transfer flavoprotein subunit beta/FixA family protein [Myxococcota bacterium]